MYGEGDGFGMNYLFQKMPLDEFKMKRLYKAHNAHVLRNCPRDKLLILESYEDWTWDKICGWLNVKVPTNIPFPHENKSGEIVEKLQRGKYLSLGCSQKYKVSYFFYCCVLLAGTNRKDQPNLKNTCEAEFRTRSLMLALTVVGTFLAFKFRKDQSLLQLFTSKINS